MRLAGWLCRRGLLGLLASLLLAAPAFADDAQLTVSQVRATAFPSITVRFTVSSAAGSNWRVELRTDKGVLLHEERIAVR